MIIFKKKGELTRFLAGEKRKKAHVGLVATMGALHEGHMALIRSSRSENDLTICSIFVNPAQFNNSEDYSNYPVKTGEDLKLLESAGCDVVFLPDYREMYENDPGTHLSFNFGKIETVCEGKFRPGHFNGVGLIVSKLFNTISPDRAYFGQKDLQQVALIRKLIADLCYPVDLRIIPTVRESDGLALSSRNLRISAPDRPKAAILYNSLLKAKKLLREGSSVDTIKKIIGNLFENEPIFRLEYLELVHAESFEVMQVFDKQSYLAFCIAAWCRNIRLIDNILINE